MTTTFIPGYFAEITIDTIDYHIVGNVLGVDGSKTVPRKPVFGQPAIAAISGQRSWTISAGGHIAAEAPTADLFAAFVNEVALPFTIQMGETGGSTDGGLLSGDLIISGLSITDDSEGEWEWSLTAEVDGDVTHTPATP